MTKPLLKVRQRFKESNVLFESDSQTAIDSAIDAVRRHRIELEVYIRLHPSFVEALQPITVETNAPRVIKMMADAGSKANVGPMAVVAGALADLAIEAMCDRGASFAIVENGGEVSAILKGESFVVALYAGQSAIGSDLGFKILPSNSPLGIATSSATIGHALSFGEADAATVFADKAALADAAATAVCNAVVSEDIERSINEGLETARAMSFVRGAIVIRENRFGSVGWVPQLVHLETR
jgi:ApbE superfamily uncharacterized protein (UPF0280 family)